MSTALLYLHNLIVCENFVMIRYLSSVISMSVFETDLQHEIHKSEFSVNLYAAHNTVLFDILSDIHRSILFKPNIMLTGSFFLSP